jgi:SAM-dependent methyltransferase
MRECDGRGGKSLPEAAWGQSDTAAAYERGRPGYAPQAIAAIAAAFQVGLGSTVVDLGAGTGKLTRQLVSTGARVVAIEPIAEMRDRFSRVLPLVAVLEGSAEAIPLTDGSVDLIVAGQAWHWFDGLTAQAEAARVLATGGGLALLWNDYDTSVPWANELAEIRNRHFVHHLPPQVDRDWRSDFAGDPDWGPIIERVFDHIHHTTRQALVDRVLSTSVIAPLPPGERANVRQEVLAILDKHEETCDRENLAVPYRTSVYWTRHG